MKADSPGLCLPKTRAGDAPLFLFFFKSRPWIKRRRFSFSARVLEKSGLAGESPVWREKPGLAGESSVWRGKSPVWREKSGLAGKKPGLAEKKPGLAGEGICAAIFHFSAWPGCVFPEDMI